MLPRRALLFNSTYVCDMGSDSLFLCVFYGTPFFKINYAGHSGTHLTFPADLGYCVGVRLTERPPRFSIKLSPPASKNKINLALEHSGNGCGMLL